MGREGAANANPEQIPAPMPAPPDESKQYDGLFKGLGISSKEPVQGKRSSALSALHQQTHFAYSCKAWETAAEGDRQASKYKTTFTDPGMVFGRVEVPYKNASVVELRQGRFVPNVHFRTEQRERYQDRGPMPRQPPCEVAESQVHFGDDAMDHSTYLSQSTMVHCLESTSKSGITPASDENRKLRGAGMGAYIDTNPFWPRPNRVDPITAGPPMPETAIIAEETRREYVQGEEPNWYPIKSANFSAVNIRADPSMRNPILGVYQKHTVKGAPLIRTEDIVAKENGRVPPLRSLGAVRPITNEDQ